jgi:DNA-directed RNA polymerase subunit E'/Rpb7
MIYIDSLLTRKVKIPMAECGKNISDILKHYLEPLEGKCITEGYLKKNSIKIVSYDSGKLTQQYINFEVVFECKIAIPTVNQTLVCEVESNTIAGLQCKLHMDNESPFIIFLAKDHHMDIPEFFSCDVGSIIHVSVIGQRYSVNDSNISVIAKLLYKQ